MDTERPPQLRTSGPPPEAAAPPGGARLGGTPPPINALAELVADLIAATGLVPADKLALVRGAAGQGSLAQALVEQDVASGEGIARTLAARYHMPLVDLALMGVAEEAKKEIPLHVLERLVAIPYALKDSVLSIAVADPGNIQAIDELRIATRYQVELGVASKEDILTEIRRLQRASEAFGARAAVEEELAIEAEEESDDLEVDDGISDGGSVRRALRTDRSRRVRGDRRGRGRRPRGRRRHLGRPAGAARQLDHLRSGRGRRERRPLRAAGGRSPRPLPDRRRAPRDTADPEAKRDRRHDAPQGAREARHRRAPEAAGRPHLAERRRRRPNAGHPRRNPAHCRGRVDRHASARQVEARADADRARPRGGDALEARGDHPPADRRAARHGPDRLR